MTMMTVSDIKVTPRHNYQRSRFPDLLFTDIAARRAEVILDQLNADGTVKEAITLPLERVTVFVTHRCNLSCHYCNGPHLNRELAPEIRDGMLQADLSLEHYQKLLAEWREHGLHYIHFTGGEPTLNPNLVEFIRLANSQGMLTALTTNGTADTELYRELVKNGLYEIRISIDSRDEVQFDRIVGVKGSFTKVIANIRELIRWRDEEEREIFLILNVTIGAFNFQEIQQITEFLIGFAPNDIKLLLIAEEQESIPARASREKIDQFLQFLSANDIRFELLNDKIKHLFRRNTFGLNGITARHLMKKCYLPLNERTVDARGIYPCSIYIRNHGRPIIDSRASFEEQQRATRDFIESQNCREDTICLKDCLRCTREFNLMMSRKSRKPLYSTQPVELSGGMVKTADLKKAAAMWYRIRETPLLKRRRFLVIKPYGIPHQDEIRTYLAGEKLGLLTEQAIPNWHELAFYLYFQAKSTVISVERFWRNRAYQMFEGGTALVVWLDAAVPYRKLARIKAEIRDCFGSLKRNILLPDGRVVEITLNSIHTPDEASLEYELKVMKYFGIEVEEKGDYNCPGLN
jgi:MoaA/NifB/PqqE/SkfB family radical SAM enzyme